MVTDTLEHRPTNPETPDVVGRPIFVLLATIPLGFGLDHLLALPRPLPGTGAIHWISAAIGFAGMLAGAAIFVAGIRNFSGAGTALPTNQPASKLVTSGIHGWTRNPIYLAFILVALGIGLLIRSPWILILTAPLAAYLRLGVIAREEAYLERRFGYAYRDYKARVRRWI